MHSCLHLPVRLETQIMDGLEVEQVMSNYEAHWEAIQAEQLMFLKVHSPGDGRLG